MSFVVTEGQWTIQDVGETAVDENGLPALKVKVTDVNRHQHLEGLVWSRSLRSVVLRLIRAWMVLLTETSERRR